MNQNYSNYKKRKLIISVVFIMLIFIIFLILLKIQAAKATSESLFNVVEIDKEKVSAELDIIMKNLDKIDSTLEANQQVLDKAEEYRDEVNTQFIKLEEKLGLATKYMKDIIGKEEWQNEIVDELQKIQNEIADNRQNTYSIFYELTEINSGKEDVQKDLGIIKESMKGIEKCIELVAERLIKQVEQMRESQNEEHLEIINLLIETEKTITLVLNEEMMALQDAMNRQFSNIHIQMEENIFKLSRKMKNIRNQITYTQKTMEELLINVENRGEENQEEIRKLFIEVQQSLSQIKADYSTTHEEIKGLIYELQKMEEAGQKELLTALGEMENGMQENSNEHFNQILNNMSDLGNQYNNSFKVLKEELNKQHNSSANTLNEIYKNISNIGSGTENHFSRLENLLGDQYNNLTNTVNIGDNALREYLSGAIGRVEQRLQEVFQSVSDGKKMVASTLLTRGVSCAEDATFAEISQAILDIPYKLVIGETQMPGEITYDYHYHTDRNGNIMHNDTTLQPGGCFNTPIYHIHKGDSWRGGGCYTIPIKHSHIDNCYRTTRTVREITSSWFTGQGSGHGCCSNSHGENWAKYRYTDKVYINGELISSVTGEGDLGYCCGLCIEKKANKKASDKTESTIICGYSEGINGYELGCGKKENTVEKYRASCGLSSGQIIGAHISYVSSKSQNSVFQESLSEESVESILVQEIDNEKEVAEQKKQTISKNKKEVKKE